MTQEHKPELYQYNALFIEKEFSGLHILTADSYTLMLNQAPDFPHNNWGDFYSEVPCGDLADKVYQLLAKESSAGDIVILPSHLFDEKKFDPSKDYIIKRNNGARIYSPKAHQNLILGPEAVYMLGCSGLWEGLFSTSKEGSLQIDYKENVQKLEEVFKELEAASQKLQQASESLIKRLEGLSKDLSKITAGEEIEILYKRRKGNPYHWN